MLHLEAPTIFQELIFQFQIEKKLESVEVEEFQEKRCKKFFRN